MKIDIDKEKSFSNDYFIVMSHFIKNILIDRDYKEKDIIKNNEEAFKFEFLILLVYLSIQKFATTFNDRQKEDRILDHMHHVLYVFLGTRRGLGKKEIENVRNNINDRYRTYDEVKNDENFLFNLSTKFLEKLDGYNGTEFKYNLRNQVLITILITLFLKIIDPSISKLKKHYKI